MFRRKRKSYQEIFEEHLNYDGDYEYSRFNYFIERYRSKIKDNSLDINKERCKLITKINDKTISNISFYVSIGITIFIFMLGNYLNYLFKDVRILLFSDGIGFIIFSILCYVMILLLKDNNNSDVWNIASIALESAVREKEEQENWDNIKSFIMKTDPAIAEVAVTDIKENNKDIEAIVNDIKQIKKFHGIS